jgi:capsular exopolysaccharide synthesis family protein
MSMTPFRQEMELDLAQYWQILRRRRWIMLETFGVIFGIGLLATLMATPIYRASGKLLVEASSSQMTTVDGDNPLAGLLALSEPDSIETQLQVLQSQPFLEEVFERVRYQHNPGKPSPDIRFEAVEDTNIIQVAVEAAEPAVAANMANAALDLHIEKTANNSLREIRRAKQFVQVECAKAKAALTAAETALSAFKREHRVTQIAAEQSNLAAQTADLEKKLLDNDYTMAGVQARLGLVQRRLQAMPAEIVKVTFVANERVVQLRNRLADQELERSVLARSYRPDSPRVRVLDWQIAELKKQLRAEPTALKLTRRETNPLREKLADQQAELATQLEGLRAAQARLKTQAESLRGRTSNLGPWEARLAQLQRERDMAQSSYLTLANKLQDLGIREEARRSTARIIQRASEPRSPVRPRKSVNIVFTIAIALCAALGVALLQERLDDRIRGPEDLERLLPVPVLGQVPFVELPEGSLVGTADVQMLVQTAYRAGWSLRQIASLKDAQMAALEAYRVVRTSVIFSAVDTGLRTLVVTSSVAGEGKTRTAVNLANAMAMEGKRVILIDADLRRPTVHRVLDLPNETGLTDCLVDMHRLPQALQYTENENLRVLTAGPLPPNPAELLNSAQMRQLTERLLQQADVILFDTPPCVPVIDARVLSAHVDGVVLVAAMDGVRCRELRTALHSLAQVRAPLLGVIANKLRGRAHLYTYYGPDRALDDGDRPAIAGSKEYR